MRSRGCLPAGLAVRSACAIARSLIALEALVTLLEDASDGTEPCL